MQIIRTPQVLWINDRDLDTLGVSVKRSTGLLGEGESAPDLAPVGGASGQTLLSLDRNLTPRPLNVQVYLQATSAAAYEQQLERLVYLCSMGTVEIRSAHIPGYVFLAKYIKHTLPKFAPEFLDGPFVFGEGELQFTALCPYPVERSFLPYTITTMGAAGRERIPTGAGPCLWEVEIRATASPSTNPVLSLYNDLGFLAGQVGWNVSLNDGDWLRGNPQRKRTQSCIAGVLALDNGLLRTGDRWFLISPAFGDWESNSPPYAELTATSGAFIAWLKVRRMKLS